MTTAIIYVPAYHRDDRQYLAECERLAHTSGITITLPLRDVATVDWVLNSGWSDLVLVARPHHAIAGWPVRVASDVAARQGATVVGLPAGGCGGRHRAATDSLIGRVMRHPTQQTRAVSAVDQALNDRARRWQRDTAEWKTRLGLRR